MRCPRCGGATYLLPDRDVYCYQCGTLRSEPNPDALLDRQRSNRPPVMAKPPPVERQLELAPAPAVVHVGQKVACQVCGRVVVQTATRRRLYCRNACKQAAHKRQRKAVAALLERMAEEEAAFVSDSHFTEAVA